MVIGDGKPLSTDSKLVLRVYIEMFNVDILIEIFIIIIMLTNAYGSAYNWNYSKNFWGEYFAAKTRLVGVGMDCVYIKICVNHEL